MMEYKDIGYDFNLIKTARITRKNYSYAYISLIFFIILFSLFSVFFVLFIIGVPFEINGITRYPGDLAYQKFFLYFLTPFGVISSIMLIIMITSLLAKPKGYIWIGTSSDGERAIYSSSKRADTYLDDSVMITLNKKTGMTSVSQNKTEIEAYLQSILFWEELPEVKVWIEKSSPGKHRVRYRINKGNAKYIKNYVLYFNSFGSLTKYRELIYLVYYGNTRLQLFSTYFINDFNQSVRLPIDSSISKMLFQIKNGV